MERWISFDLEGGSRKDHALRVARSICWAWGKTFSLSPTQYDNMSLTVFSHRLALIRLVSLNR
jgi:hypothetical protein